MKKLVLGLFSLALLTTACKKSKDTPALTKENLAGTYIQIAATVSMNNSPAVDAFSELDPCEKDDQYKLNLDGSFAIVDAGTQCDPTTEFTGGTWSLNGNTITIVDDSDVSSSTITKFDGTTLEMTSEYTDAGITYVFKSTHKKQ